ncbi:toll/interleukin-1 receptor domain-containing protein [Aurantiacibacter gilvus]|uniref:Toll/interleukin-1 receptor domain-containing protein n=1 Tax=Aurantiacibacter gilvus TaxID=3139141 RepID=A0ABU9IF80_9SPHN
MQEDSAKEVRLFVSHHSSTYDTAMQVEELLARRGVTCWIAPRDVEPGEPFDKAISNAIHGSAAILLLFCEQSDRSRHVKRELILADTAARPIIPLRLEAINPGELAYHLADSQWIDWIDRREAVMDRVANQARQYAAVVPAIDGPIPQSHRPVAEAGGGKPKPWAWIAAALAALVAVVAVTWIVATQGGDEDTTELAAESAEEVTPEPDTVSGEPEELAEAEPGPTPTTAPTSAPIRQVTVAPQPSPTPTQAPAAAGPLQRVVDACRGAATDTEYLICADPTLGSRAREIGTLIGQVREALAGDETALRAFNSEQRAWFNAMKANCHDAACVTQRQTSRMAALRAILAR